MWTPGRPILAVAIVGILAFGVLGLGGTLAQNSAGVAGAGASSSAASAPAPNIAQTMGETALAATHAARLSDRYISVPRPSASAAQIAQSQASGHVTPLYSGAPNPAGVAYYGLSEGSHGTVVPTAQQTRSLEGGIDMQGSGVYAQDLYSSSPDAFGMQLNAVQTNVSILGNNSYSFWTQDIVLYFPASSYMILITNIWNFSGPLLPSNPDGVITNNALYSQTLGCVDASCASSDFGYQQALHYYYSALVIPFPVSYPWQMTMYMNSTLTMGRDGVSFAVDLSQGSGQDINAQYDTVVFNSILPDQPLTFSAPYTANGFAYNPVHLTNDWELIFGGPNGGSNADIASADATLSLGYWNSQLDEYLEIPSAYNYGGETGETVTGMNVAWADSGGIGGAEPDALGAGPLGFSDWGTVSAGPNVVSGLWGAGAPEGTWPVTFNVNPASAWIVVTPDNDSTDVANFLYAVPFAESDLYGPTFWHTPGTYFVKVELSYYDQVPKGPTLIKLHLDEPKVLNINLHFNPLEGVYTPLWAFSNSEIAGLSTSGNGTEWNPYMLFNNQYRDFASWFGLYNDWTFPVYPGVFFYDTTAYTYLEHAPSFTAKTSLNNNYPGPYLPGTNQLQYWFWSVSGFALYDASNISGWFGGGYPYSPFTWDPFNVIFYNSSNNLIAGNTFGTEAQALLMYAGGSAFGPANSGGGDNTVWGNAFLEYSAPPSDLALMTYAEGVGLTLGENGDLIYNNWFATPTTAFMLPLNLYSDDPYLYTDAWNITPIGAAHVNTASGFPLIPLTGSIAGGSIQGGNFWWDYGTTAGSPNPYNGAINPYGVLPYDENATTLVAYFFGPEYYSATYIYNGGDYAPFEHPKVHLG